MGLWGAVVHALSSAGNRLLAILDDVADKDLFSTFWKDLEGEIKLHEGWGWTNWSYFSNSTSSPGDTIGRGYSISFQSPKDQSLSLFKHGERAYDHIALFPLKSKGQ